jgi:diacylglycerol kinase (ATP)
MKQRALLLANRNSRRCCELLDPALEALRAHDFDITQPDTLPPRDALTTLIRANASQHNCIIVMGGDGSINAALPGVLQSNVPLGIIPAGTANDLARTLALPTDVTECVKIIAAGHVRHIDVARVNDKPFINAASIGISVDITRQLDKPFKKRWGKLAYVLAASRALFRMRPFTADIICSTARTTTRSVQIVVGNGRYFGTGMTVDAEAAINDGVLHLYSITAAPWWRLLTLLPVLRAGTHAQSTHVVNITDTHILIQTPRPRTVTADGEIVSQTPARFDLTPQAIRVFVADERKE